MISLGSSIENLGLVLSLLRVRCNPPQRTGSGCQQTAFVYARSGSPRADFQGKPALAAWDSLAATLLAKKGPEMYVEEEQIMK